MTQKQLKIDYVPTSQLKPNPKNPRKNDAAVGNLVKSISSFGWTNPILAARDNTIIAGHTRWKAAQQEGMDKVPVIYLDIDPNDANVYMIADNKLTEIAEWDKDVLAELMIELKDLGKDLALTGFSADDIALMTDPGAKDGLTDEDSVPAVPETYITQPGDVYILGNHRLICGDSTKQDDINTLMDGKLADMVFTDPPYNVNYKQLLKGDSKRKLKNNVQKVESYIMNDNMSDEEFYGFLFGTYSCMFNALKPGRPIYVCHADSERLNFTKAFVDVGFKFAQAIIWVKSCPTLSRSDFNWKHEPILYSWKPGEAHKFYGGFCLTSVIDDDTDLDKLKKEELQEILRAIYEQMPQSIIRVDKPSNNDLHPTMKPVSLVQRCIEWSSLPGDLILESFGGSGTTLIAAEKTGRTCYACEIMPQYCDVIVERWEKFTGKTAERIPAMETAK
jgi:DNA modification methylase